VNLVDHLADHPALRRIADSVRAARRVAARGSQGSSAAFTAAALGKLTDRPVLLIVAHLDDADEAVEELSAAGVDAFRLPALEVLPGETGVSLDLFAERVAAVRRALALSPDDRPVIVCPVQALMQPVPAADSLSRLVLTLRAGDTHPPAALARWLQDAGYERVDAIEEPGQFAVRGGIMDIFPSISPLAGAAARGTAALPVRLDFFGDTVERLCEIDLATMASDRTLDAIELVCASLERAMGAPPSDGAKAARQPGQRETFDAVGGSAGVGFFDVVPPAAAAILSEPLEITEQARGYFERVTDARIFAPPALFKALHARFRSIVELSSFTSAAAASDAAVELPVEALPALPDDAGDAVKELGVMARGGDGSGVRRVAVFCGSPAELSRMGELLDEHAPAAKPAIAAAVSYVHRGFVFADLAVVPYHEMLHRYESRRRTRGGAGGDARLKAGRALDTFLDFAPDDFVVHRDHGIAIFRGLVAMKPREVKRAEKVVLPSERPKKKSTGAGEDTDPDEGFEEYLTLEFAGSSKLHVPASTIDLVQKYVGGFRGKPQLSSLGGTRWRKQKDSVAESVKDLAGELLRVRAAREHLPGVRFPADTAWQREFEDEFPFEETQDQLAALGEIKKDMTTERPMDRLLCGDVGYGKTELAVRAAFKACEFGKQVAVLVPTTVLAEQHERTFKGRFADYPFRVESISRFKTTGEVNAVLADLRKGQVDVVVGTHRLLSKDVKFADLGLVVIDEEQRFGVEHKERLLSLRMTVDVLTLSATPIPRTLHMSMLGLRDISSLATAPVERRPIVTEVIPYNAERVRRAIARELAREGQVFFVHNRVHNIRTVADEVQKLAPGARVIIGHGQMPDGELEEVMLTFMRRQADILVSTTIIESGIDIPTANTMIINDADRFGLAELHQLRGRVGRSKHRAYCYLLLPNDRPVGEVAVKRLKAIEEFSMLGAGFKIAMRDLEIRGAGNILGPEQSGHIAAVGYEMYCQLLETAVKELRHEPTNIASETSVEIGVSGMIPKRYIPSDQRRMAAYRRIAVAQTPDEVARIETELLQAYGPPLPPATRRLLDLAELRTIASQLRVRSISVRGQDVLLRARPGDAERVGELLRRRPDARTADAPDHVVVLPPKTGEDHAEVYFRPPPRFLEPATLLAVLRKRLRPDAQAPAAPAVHSRA
jgi:transcription-repair coupling factor (superfamily II helicase)